MRPQHLLAAYILDLVLGDPQGWPHPVRWMGRMISSGDRWVGRLSRSPTGELLGGAVLANSIVALSFLASRYAIERLSRRQKKVGLAAEVLLAWTCLATRSLQKEAGGVVDALDAGDLPPRACGFPGLWEGTPSTSMKPQSAGLLSKRWRRVPAMG